VRVVVSGSHGFIGSALVAALTAAGHDVTPLVRSEPGPGQVRWDPAADMIDTAALTAARPEAAVHLAGVGIGDRRWTERHKAAVLSSRVEGTGLLARTLAALDPPPAVLVSQSAVGYYGDRGDEELTEADGPGTGFLAEVVQAWEAAAEPARQAGIRVVHTRTGVVLSPAGGALRRQVLPFKLGLGGRMGSGRQWLSWISLDDEVAAILHVLATPALTGPVNCTAPDPVTNAEFTRALGRALRRPTLVPTPTLALRALLGRGLVEEMILAGQRVKPAALVATGFTFRHPEIGTALRAMLGR
jgi:uncharacterized protein (TIGR01777 family)